MCRISEECLLALSEEYCFLGSEISCLIKLLRDIRTFRNYALEVEGVRGRSLLAIASMFDEFVCVELYEVAARNPKCQEKVISNK